jgi:hypothetical protein
MQGSNANFNATTRSFTQSLTPMVMQAPGTTTSLDLPQTGYLAAIDLIFTGTVTLSSGSVTPNATFPWGLINGIQLRTNEGADIWNTTGWGANVYQNTLRSGFAPDVGFSQAMGTALAYGRGNFITSYFDQPTGGSAITSTFNFALPVRLQLSWGEMLQAGLILLQNPGVRFTLSINWGTVGQIGTSESGITFSNAQVIPALELFLVPQEDTNQPDLSLAKTVLEDTQPITGAGVFQYSPPRGNTYTRLIQYFADGATGNPAMTPSSTANVSQFQVVYSQTQNINNDLVANKLWRQRRLYGFDLYDGVYVHEYSLGNGCPEFPNGRDNIDTSQITDMSINTTIGGTVTAGASVRTVKEQLVVVQS